MAKLFVPRDGCFGRIPAPSAPSSRENHRKSIPGLLLGGSWERFEDFCTQTKTSTLTQHHALSSGIDTRLALLGLLIEAEEAGSPFCGS